MKAALDRLYTAFNVPDSAVDPVQVVRRYEPVEDREIVAFVAAGLAFGRVASVMASVEAACALLGPTPAAYIRSFDPERDRPRFAPFVHRWTRGVDLAGVFWILRRLIEQAGSLERAVAEGIEPSARDVGPALEGLARRARAVDLTPVYGRVPPAPGAYYFFSRPSTGSACKRLNLFLRWMARHDRVDPGGWTSVPVRQLVVPLDTHTIRLGQCLRLTRRRTPGWLMASEITESLRAFDPEDPVRYDFSLCHLSMMGGCGYGTRRGNSQCPLAGYCRPRKRR